MTKNLMKSMFFLLLSASSVLFSGDFSEFNDSFQNTTVPDVVSNFMDESLETLKEGMLKIGKTGPAGIYDTYHKETDVPKKEVESESVALEEITIKNNDSENNNREENTKPHLLDEETEDMVFSPKPSIGADSLSDDNGSVISSVEDNILRKLLYLGAFYNKQMVFVTLGFGVLLAILFPQETKSIVTTTTSKIKTFFSRIAKKFPKLRRKDKIATTVVNIQK